MRFALGTVFLQDALRAGNIVGYPADDREFPDFYPTLVWLPRCSQSTTLPGADLYE